MGTHWSANWTRSASAVIATALGVFFAITPISSTIQSARAQALTGPLAPTENKSEESYLPEKISKIEVNLVPERDHRSDQATIREQIHSSEGAYLNPTVVTEDIRRIYNMGFFDDIQVEWFKKDAGVELTFHVKERPIVGEILFEGIDEEETEIKRIVKRAKARLDRFYDPDLMKRVAQELRVHFEGEGNFLTEIDIRTSEMENNKVSVTFVVEPHEKLTIRKLDILGNQALSDEEVKADLANQESSFFSFVSQTGTYQKSLLFQRDVEWIRQFYATKGYAFAKVGTPTVTLLPDRKGIHIALSVSEGQQYDVGLVDLEGDFLDDKEELIEKVAIEPGKTFNIQNLFIDMQTLSRHYRDQGYAFADVSYRLLPDHENRRLGIVYTLQKGSLVRIGRISVTGNVRTLDEVVRREVRIHEGDYYSESLIERSQMLIERTGYFRSVQVRKKVRALEDGTQVLDLEINVTRQQTGSFQVGMGFSSFESFMFMAQIAEQNFLGRGFSLSFNALISSLRSIFSVRFRDPYFLDTNVTFGFSLFNRKQVYVDFEQEERGGSITSGYRFTDDLGAYMTYNFRHAESQHGPSAGRTYAPVATASREALIGSLEGLVSYDTRNNRILPTSGQYSTFSLERGDKYLGSDVDYTRYSARSRWFFPFVLGTTLRLNGEFVHILTDDSNGLPIFERLFGGGIFDIRGFRRWSLGPELPVARRRDPSSTLYGFTLGGNKKLVSNVELELPIIKQAGISAVAFLDAGNAYGEGETPAFDNIRESAGFGVRWWSPVGPLRFEWGFPLDRKPGEDDMVFEFTIGAPY